MAALLPDDFRPFILWWLDDIFVHSPKIIDQFKAISGFFDFFVKYNLKLHPGKSTLFARTIRWCGRTISADCVLFDHRRIDGIVNMVASGTDADLQQFVSAMQWMRARIPEISADISPLVNLPENVYHIAGMRTRLAAGRVSLAALGWTFQHDKAFKLCKKALEYHITLAHADPAKRL